MARGKAIASVAGSSVAGASVAGSSVAGSSVAGSSVAGASIAFYKREVPEQFLAIDTHDSIVCILNKLYFLVNKLKMA